MYGVVLWSDQEQNRAVIWCEDHGDLAFYSGTETSVFDAPDLDAGDLVQFELTRSRNMRLAINPKLIAEDEYPTLAQALRDAGQEAEPAPVQQPSSGARIIPFGQRRENRKPAPAAALATG